MKGYGTPIYVNKQYPFPKNPPFIPASNNPVGSYIKHFTIPSEWLDRRIFIKFDAIKSAGYFWINEEFLGYHQDSKTAAEFEITEFITEAKNTIAIQIYRYSEVPT